VVPQLLLVVALVLVLLVAEPQLGLVLLLRLQVLHPIKLPFPFLRVLFYRQLGRFH
jgi:hypothetical protein